MSVEDLEVDEQVTAMCWAASKITGQPVTAAYYNVLVKPTWKAKPRGVEETPEDFEQRVRERIMDEAGRYFFRTSAITRPVAVQEAWQREVVQEVAPLMVAGIQYGRHKATWGGACRWCKFRPVCAVWHDEDARKAVLNSDLYERRQK